QASVISRTAGSNLFDHRAVDFIAGLQLLPQVRREITKAKSPAGLAMAGVGALVVVLALSHRLQRDRKLDGVAIPESLEVQRSSGLLFSDFDLQRARVAHGFPVEFNDDVTDFQPRLRARGVRLDLRHDGSRSVIHVKELRLLGSDVADPDADIPVVHFSVLDQGVDRRPHDLRGNRKSHAGEAARLGDQERVDAHNFSVSIHQRTAGVPGVDGRVRLNELSRRTAVSGVWIRPVQRADNAASYSEAESQRIAECEHSLTGVQLRRVSQRNAGQVGAVDLDYGKISQRVGADQLRRQDSAVSHGDANIHRAVDDVVVGDDVAVGRNDHAAAQSMFCLGLRAYLPKLAAEMLSELFSERSKELLQPVGVVAAVVVTAIV